MNPEATPRQIVAKLDSHIIGQAAAKQAVAVALRNRWRRQHVAEELRGDITPHNILMIGPTGVGKTEISRRVAQIIQAPFLKVEATRYTEVGYVGRDVETIIRDLTELAVKQVRSELVEAARPTAEEATEDKLVDLLANSLGLGYDDEKASSNRARLRALRDELRAGQHDDRIVTLNVEERPNAPSMFPGLGFDNLDGEMQATLESLLPGRSRERRLTLAKARRIIFTQEADKLIDRDTLVSTAVERVENRGIVFLDEIDKLAGISRFTSGPDISRQGVQRDLLPIVEGTTVNTRHGPVRTNHILFIAAGAFHDVKPSDLMPELQGRFPVRVTLDDLTEADFAAILREPDHSLIKQQIALLAVDGLAVHFRGEALDEIARIAYWLNRTTVNIGARRLHTVLEKVVEQLAFDAPDNLDGLRSNALNGSEGHGRPARRGTGPQRSAAAKSRASATANPSAPQPAAVVTLEVDAAFVRQRLADMLRDEDMGRYIL